jgi:GT2 family glycosyltransferase
VKLGIVLVTFECRDFVLGCLESIEAQLGPAALDGTVVVDNASTDDTVEVIRARYPAVHVVPNARNLGFARAVNIGLRELAGSDVICVLNPDSVLLDADLISAAGYLDSQPQLGAAGVRILNPNGSLQASCREFPGFHTAFFNRHSLTTRFLPGNRWSRRYLMADWAHDTVRDVDWVAFSCVLLHRRAIERVGLLDEGYFWSIEDVDYCRRLHDAGLGVVYYPMASVKHLIGGSSRKAVYAAMEAHHRGMWRYYRQHMRGGRLTDIATATGIAARFGLHAASYAVRSKLGRIEHVAPSAMGSGTAATPAEPVSGVEA